MKNIFLRPKKLKFNGYTLLEVTIVLAIIGLFTLTLVSSGTDNLKTERFSGNVKEFANTIRKAQVGSYTIRTDTCNVPQTCFWRGNVLDLEVGNDFYQFNLLLGKDISTFSDTSSQSIGITSKRFQESYSLADKGLSLSEITVNGQRVNSISVAFLAPDGRAASTSPFVSNFNANTPAYSSDGTIVFTLTAVETPLKGFVTYDPKTGKLEVSIR